MACGGQYDWRNPNGVLVTQDSSDPSEETVFRAHAPPQDVCENLVCALKLLVNQQTGGDSLIDTLVEGFQDQSRMKIMDELRRFIGVENHTVAKIGDLEKNSVAIKGAGPSFDKERCSQTQRSGKEWLT